MVRLVVERFIEPLDYPGKFDTTPPCTVSINAESAVLISANSRWLKNDNNHRSSALIHGGQRRGSDLEHAALLIGDQEGCVILPRYRFDLEHPIGVERKT